MDILYLMVGFLLAILCYNSYHYWENRERKRKKKQLEKTINTIETITKNLTNKLGNENSQKLDSFADVFVLF